MLGALSKSSFQRLTAPRESFPPPSQNELPPPLTAFPRPAPGSIIHQSEKLKTEKQLVGGGDHRCLRFRLNSKGKWLQNNINQKNIIQFCTNVLKTIAL